ncbi:unnamed protein product [Didymodactylos carnosus]|uniref:Uncharacterized protein n=1 Tax=Didymodactylos carnosus TaxID=1234261 RepID=A0A8S2E7D7_9BILA|nr:unnamed protein product [Didymodactylos carnosus]CAF3858246.1 unnamed protein product [Didymodactylos carnosus]
MNDQEFHGFTSKFKHYHSNLEDVDDMDYIDENDETIIKFQNILESQQNNDRCDHSLVSKQHQQESQTSTDYIGPLTRSRARLTNNTTPEKSQLNKTTPRRPKKDN